MWLGGRLLFGDGCPRSFADWWNDVGDGWYCTVIGVHASIIMVAQGVILLPARPPGMRSARDVPWRQHLLAAIVVGLLCAGVYASMIALYDSMSISWLQNLPQLHGFLVSTSMVFLVGSTGAFVAFGVLVTAFKERTPLGLVACICALCSAALLGGLGYIGCAIWRVSHGEDTSDRALSLVLGAILVMWVFATPLLSAFLRRRPGEARNRPAMGIGLLQLVNRAMDDELLEFLDPGLAHLVGRHALAAATAQIGDHLVLEGEPDELHAFCVQHLVEGA